MFKLILDPAMKIKFVVFILLLFIAGAVNAQSILKGTVYEAGSNDRMANVFIHDITNKQITLTDKNGNFRISTAPGHILIFNSPTYASDTLYVTDMSPKKIHMITLTIALRQVNVNARHQTFNPRTEYPEVYTKSKIYILSPTSWFSKSSRDARRLKHYFAREEQERHVDEVFNPAYVGSLVPLKGRELEDFMTLYRPTYAFLRNNNGPSLAAYINDSYKKFMALPADKRSLPGLTSE